MVKNIFKTAVLLFILQMLRILFKSVIFLFVERTLMTDVSVNCIYTALAILLSIYIFKSKNINIDFLPKDFNIKYKAATAALLIFMITTPVITKSISLYSIMSLIYNAVLTVIYEELIFRGYIYKKLQTLGSSRFAYVYSSIFFGLWHLGYIDTILWRTSLFFTDADFPSIMFWKAVTGLIIGLILGFFRYKKNNVYSSVIVHSFINTFGS